MRTDLLAVMVAALAAQGARADDGTCRNGLFPTQNPEFRRASVTGTGRLFFQRDTDNCPAAAAQCRTSSYVVPGDRLVVGRSRGAFVCAFYPHRGGGTAGWVEAVRLKPITSAPRPPATAWVGRWSDFGNPQLVFTRRRDGLHVKGDACWPSCNPSPAKRAGGPNVGAVEGRLVIEGNRGREAECDIRFTLLGDVLVAADPTMQCGGANVSFSGVYARTR